MLAPPDHLPARSPWSHQDFPRNRSLSRADRPQLKPVNCHGTSRLDLLLQTLREHQSDLMAAGVRHAEIFGSFARRQATESSDVDILVDLDPDARVNIFDFVGIEMQLSDLLKRRVDLVSRRGLKPGRHENIAAEAIAAF